MSGLIVLLFVIVIIAAFVRSPWFKGAAGEFAVNLGSRLFLDKSEYHLVKNVTLPVGSGTTQIDHVIVSRYGIFVVETKNMNGAIYGGEHQPQWTQAFGRNKFRFQNPLHQNYKHTRVLADILGVPHGVMRPIVMFIGDAKLMTSDELPPNVLTGGYAGYIKSFREVVLSDEEVARVLRVIEQQRLEPGFGTHREHVRHVRDIVDRKDRGPVAASGDPPDCPRCGRTMVLRTARRGKNAGSRFWGCPGYPGCRGIVKAGQTFRS